MTCFQKTISILRLNSQSQGDAAGLFNVLTLATHDGTPDSNPNPAVESALRLETMGLALSHGMRRALNEAARNFVTNS